MDRIPSVLHLGIAVQVVKMKDRWNGIQRLPDEILRDVNHFRGFVHSGAGILQVSNSLRRLNLDAGVHH